MFSRHPRRCACQALLPACDFHPRKRLSGTQWPEITEMPSSFLRRTDNLFQSLKKSRRCSTPLVLTWKIMKVEKAAHPMARLDQVVKKKPAVGSASAPPGRWELLQDWLGSVGLVKAQGHPWPSLLLPRPKPSAMPKLEAYGRRKKVWPKFLELDFLFISSFTTRFLSIGPPNTQNLPMARRCKGIFKTHFHVWHLQMADICGKCLLSKLFWSKFSSA